MEKNIAFTNDVYDKIANFSDEELIEILLNSGDFNGGYIELINNEAFKRKIDLSVVEEKKQNENILIEEKYKMGLSPNKSRNSMLVILGIISLLSMLGNSSLVLFFYLGPFVFVYFGLLLKYSKLTSKISGTRYNKYNMEGRSLGNILLILSILTIASGLIMGFLSAWFTK